MVENKIFVFKRPCIRCNELFIKTGKAQKICEGCSLQGLTVGERKRKRLKND